MWLSVLHGQASVEHSAWDGCPDACICSKSSSEENVTFLSHLMSSSHKHLDLCSMPGPLQGEKHAV